MTTTATATGGPDDPTPTASAPFAARHSDANDPGAIPYDWTGLRDWRARRAELERANRRDDDDDLITVSA